MKRMTILPVCLALHMIGMGLHAQTINIPVSEVLPAPYGNGADTLPNGTIVTASIVTTCSCTPAASTGYNGSSSSSNLGGIYSGNTMAAYSGNSTIDMLTGMSTAGTAFNGTGGTGSGNLSGALGFWIHFSDSLLINSMLLLDIDGTSGNPNREWTSVFGYNTLDPAGPQIVTYTGAGTTSSRVVPASMVALTSSWGTMVSSNLSTVPVAQLPTISNVNIWRSNMSGPVGTGDVLPGDTLNQVLFTAPAGRMVTDLFILYGLYDNGNNTPSIQAAAVGPIVTDIPIPLPLHIISFSGVVDDNNAVLSWETTNEEPSEYFEIQRSDDGANFKTIGKMDVSGKESDSRYTFRDPGKLVKEAMYRIRVANKNRSAAPFFSRVIYLKPSGTVPAIFAKVYPNPVTDYINLDLAGAWDLLLRDINGNSVKQEHLNGNSLHQVDCRDLRPGVYHLQLVSMEGEVRSLFITKK